MNIITMGVRFWITEFSVVTVLNKIVNTIKHTSNDSTLLIKFCAPQIDFVSVYSMNKDLFKPKPSSGGGSHTSSTSGISQPQSNGSSKIGGRRAGFGPAGRHDRKMVVTPAKVS